MSAPREPSLVVTDPCACSDPACCDRMVELVLVWPEKPWLMNADNNLHHRQRAKMRAEWRDAFADLARGCPPMRYAKIVVCHETATRRKVDACACAPAYKAALDGVVAAGVLPDDGPEFVGPVVFNAPEYTGRDALVITLTGPASA